MKRFTTFILLTAILASLAACGGDASADTTAPGGDTTTAIEVDPLMPTTVKEF